MSAKEGYRRILVATDFSPDADAALAQAVWLARSTVTQSTGASLTLAHALPDLRRTVRAASAKAKLDLIYGEGEEFDREVRQASEAKMRAKVEEFGAHDLDVTLEVLLGEPAAELDAAVQNGEYDLVLAGTRGMSAWEQFFIGSTAKRLIRSCPTSVWIVSAGHVGAPETVLAPTDFSEVSKKAVRHGLWIARQASAEFHLLHVVDSMDVPEDVISKIPQGSSLRQEINEEARSRLDAFVQSLPPHNARIQVHLLWGTPWKEVQGLAQRIAADLIAIGTVGRSGIQGLFLGNTAEKVLDTCRTSVLTVKPDDFATS